MQSDDTAQIPLRAHDGTILAYTTVDKGDEAWANQWTWRLSSWGYAIRSGGKVRLHRELLGLPRVTDGREGDHIDLDKLNNRRGNLRVAPNKAAQRQNLSSRKGSTSKYRGVSWDRTNKKWAAHIQINGKQTNLGRFTTEEAANDAARAARARLMPYAVE